MIHYVAFSCHNFVSPFLFLSLLWVSVTVCFRHCVFPTLCVSDTVCFRWSLSLSLFLSLYLSIFSPLLRIYGRFRSCFFLVKAYKYNFMLLLVNGFLLFKKRLNTKYPLLFFPLSFFNTLIFLEMGKLNSIVIQKELNC